MKKRDIATCHSVPALGNTDMVNFAQFAHAAKCNRVLEKVRKKNFICDGLRILSILRIYVNKYIFPTLKRLFRRYRLKKMIVYLAHLRFIITATGVSDSDEIQISPI